MLDNRIHSIALIGARNNPLYVRNFASGAPSSSSQTAAGSAVAGYDAQAAAAGELKTNYIAHSALDVVEERSAFQTLVQFLQMLTCAFPALTAAAKQQEQYLGLLFTIEDVAVYGFQTSTRLKIIVMLLLSDQIVKDIDMITVRAHGSLEEARLPHRVFPSLPGSSSLHTDLPRNSQLLLGVFG